ncbi:inactive protein RESTRICTED TEV MOVEMENT 2-like [Mercurialis annua]|uniref:inactive protein RESTRICTED TEV MOVEMENT 2-like n=1 Tax=Mercurialis annua TaxID=3986 RepID=UPI0021610126|nr:inactive protein RESTRICTED TEV MOVEMENT 2-like [Mercurialis annua]
MEAKYEDFKPNSEWKEEEATNLLLIYLPDFNKEQLKITYVHTSRVLKVAGERQISDKKWSRFSELFSVPQNCNVQKIQGKFHNGVLTVTMPKTTITPTLNLGPKKDDGKKESEINKKIKESSEITEKKTESSQVTEKRKESTLISEKRKEPPEITEKSKKLSEITEKIKESPDITAKGKKSSEITETIKESLDIAEKDKESAKISEKIKESSKITEKRKESPEINKNRKEGVKRSKKKESKLGMELTQESQSLYNIGVAVLVIAALGTYIYCTHGSSSSATSKH